MDDAFDDDSASYDRRLAAAEHSRLGAAFEQGGFRAGLEEGKGALLQAGFDAGFARSAALGFARGRLQGALAAAGALLAGAGVHAGSSGAGLRARATALAAEVDAALQPSQLTQAEAEAAVAVEAQAVVAEEGQRESAEGTCHRSALDTELTSEQRAAMLDLRSRVEALVADVLTALQVAAEG